MYRAARYPDTPAHEGLGTVRYTVRVRDYHVVTLRRAKAGSKGYRLS